MTLISPSFTRNDDAEPSPHHAALTDSREAPHVKNSHSSGTYNNISLSIFDEIAPVVGLLGPLEITELVETVRRLLTVAVAEAVADYERCATAAALAAVTTLAETAVKAAGDAAAAATEHGPRMDYSLKEAGFLLSRGKRALQYELDQGIVIGTHKGASHRISHAELQRQVMRDDGRGGQKRGKRKPPNSDKRAGFSGSKSA